tara:strand:+ start:352 stop:531 length:180 start_codon:yes stop_codon:yes gene_type:complete
MHSNVVFCSLGMVKGFAASTGTNDRPKKIVQPAKKQAVIPLMDLATKLPDISTRHRCGD